jgi:hypothetical protein
MTIIQPIIDRRNQKFAGVFTHIFAGVFTPIF